MKVLFVEGKRKLKEYFPLDKNFINTLPKKIFLVYLAQFKAQAEAMKTELEKNNIEVKGFRQVLGCTKLQTPYQILLIGNGKFHALNLAMQNKLPIILYNNSNSITIGEKEVKEIEKKKLAAESKFLIAKNIGIIVSTKPGQENLQEAGRIKKKIEKKYPEKSVFIFLSNTINLSELENFPINFWINTACPRIVEDSNKIYNIDDISELL